AKHLRQARIARQRDDGAVEQLVMLDDGGAVGWIAAPDFLPHRHEALAMSAIADPFRGAARRLALQQGADFEQVRHFLRRQTLHGDTAIWHQADEAFGRKPAERLAEGAAAVGDFLGEIADHEPLARRKTAADDAVANGPEDDVDRFAVAMPRV